MAGSIQAFDSPHVRRSASVLSPAVDVERSQEKGEGQHRKATARD